MGYAFCRKEYWKRTFWYRFVVVTMYFNTGIIPWYMVMKIRGLVNNFWAYVLPALVLPFFMKTLLLSFIKITQNLRKLLLFINVVDYKIDLY